MSGQWVAYSLRAVPPRRTVAERRQRLTDLDEGGPRVAVALVRQNEGGGILARLAQVHPARIVRVDRDVRDPGGWRA